MAKVLTVDPLGNITTIFGGQSYPSSFIDSGSNGIFFLDAAATGLPVCPDSADFYCPAMPQSLSATNAARTGSSSPRRSTWGMPNARYRFSAFNEIAGLNPGGFDFGLGFFFGRERVTAIEGRPRRGARGRTSHIERQVTQAPAGLSPRTPAAAQLRGRGVRQSAAATSRSTALSVRQFVVPARFDDAAAFEHVNPVRVQNRREPMRDEHGHGVAAGGHARIVSTIPPRSASRATKWLRRRPGDADGGAAPGRSTAAVSRRQTPSRRPRR